MTDLKQWLGTYRHPFGRGLALAFLICPYLLIMIGGWWILLVMTLLLLALAILCLGDPWPTARPAPPIPGWVAPADQPSAIWTAPRGRPAPPLPDPTSTHDPRRAYAEVPHE